MSPNTPTASTLSVGSSRLAPWVLPATKTLGVKSISIAMHSGVHPANISAALHRRRRLPELGCRALAEALGIAVSDLGRMKVPVVVADRIRRALESL